MAKKNWDVAFYTQCVKIIVFLRLLFGPTIFFFPRITAVISFLLDWVDGEIYKRAGYNHERYSFYDKILDYYWYIWILLYILTNNIPYKPLFIFLFLYRTLGQILFFFTKKEMILFFFFNAFEILFFYYLAVTTINGNGTILLQPKAIETALILIIAIVLIREYILHIRQANLSNTILGHTTYWSKITYNKYRVFGFLVFLIAFFGLIPLTSSPDFFYYITKAQNNFLGNNISYYSSQGYLVGNLSQKYENGIFNLKLSEDPNFLNPHCNGKVEVLKDTNHTTNGLTFVYRDNCLVNLTDGKYFLRLFTDNQKHITITVEFSIKNGNLTD